eukprot:TRINITY_DN8068_c0_g1_i1.p1 TRINITY_DN8068_c0_g1~~TRINITY_DN8068_c0_g1_i1.p1  ORF type:complete len:239 (+),score=24.38 TRINITY_DN8068_c0_g1_i1:333-1049(+)
MTGRPVERFWNEEDGRFCAHPAVEVDKSDVHRLRCALSSIGGPDSPRVSSESMGVLSRGVFGTLGLRDITEWGKPAKVGGEEIQSNNSNQSQHFGFPSPTSVFGFRDDHVSIDMSLLEQSESRNLKASFPSVSGASVGLKALPTMMSSPAPPTVSCRVRDEFPGLNLKPIRTRPSADQLLPTIYVTRCQSYTPDTLTTGLLVQQKRGGFSSGMWRMMAQLGTAMGACLAAALYVVGIE